MIIDNKKQIHKRNLLFQRGISRGGSRTAATSRVELFVIIVNGWKSLTIITKSSTLDVAAVSDPPLISCYWRQCIANLL